nr:MFS transporter [Pseudomonas sp.]
VGLRLVGALLIGLAYGPITPASSQILARTTPPRKMGFVFSVKQTGVPLGGLFAGLLLPAATLSSWRTSLLSLAVSALVVALVCNPLRRRLDEPAAPAKRSANVGQTLKTILQHRALRSIAAVSLLFAVCQLSLGGYLVVYLHQEVGLSLVDAGIVYAVAQGAGVVGRLVWGRIADATGQPNTVMLVIAMLMGASAVGTGMLGPQWSMFAVCVMAALFGGTAIGWNGVFLGEVARLAPPNSGVAAITGGVLSFTYVGVMVGPLLFGYIGQSVGSLGTAFMSLALVTAAAMVLLARVRRPPVRRPAER